MKTYRGRRSNQGCVVEVEDNGKVYPLPPCNDIRNHSPTGFNWGYPGSGPAQLALAIAMDVLEDSEQAQAVYQTLKDNLIAGINANEWTIPEQQVIVVIRRALLEWYDEEGRRQAGG